MAGAVAGCQQFVYFLAQWQHYAGEISDILMAASAD